MKIVKNVNVFAAMTEMVEKHVLENKTDIQYDFRKIKLNGVGRYFWLVREFGTQSLTESEIFQPDSRLHITYWLDVQTWHPDRKLYMVDVKEIKKKKYIGDIFEIDRNKLLDQRDIDEKKYIPTDLEVVSLKEILNTL